MTTDRPADYLASLVRELCALPRETEWAEFKLNEAEPQAIGEYLSALANAAALTGKALVLMLSSSELSRNQFSNNHWITDNAM